MVVIMSGDSDMIPAVAMARNEGVVVRLAVGPKSVAGTANYHQDLWDQVDERLLLTQADIDKLRR